MGFVSCFMAWKCFWLQKGETEAWTYTAEPTDKAGLSSVTTMCGDPKLADWHPLWRLSGRRVQPWLTEHDLGSQGHSHTVEQRCPIYTACPVQSHSLKQRCPSSFCSLREKLLNLSVMYGILIRKHSRKITTSVSRSNFKRIFRLHTMPISKSLWNKWLCPVCCIIHIQFWILLLCACPTL